MSGEGDRAGRFAGVLDATDGAIYGLAALVVLGLLLLRGLIAAHRVGGPVLLVAALVGCVGVVVIVARDAQRRRWSPVSITLAIAYALCLAGVVVADVLGS